MEIAGSVITVLFVVGFMACLVGLIRPSLFAKRGAAPPPRREFLTCIVSMLVLLAIGGAIFFPDEPAAPEQKNGKEQQQRPADDVPQAAPAKAPPPSQSAAPAGAGNDRHTPAPADKGLDFPVAEWLARQNEKARAEGMSTFYSASPGTVCAGSCLQIFFDGAGTHIIVRQQYERITSMLVRGEIGNKTVTKEYFMQLRNVLATLVPGMDQAEIDESLLAVVKTLFNENQATMHLGELQVFIHREKLDYVQAIITRD